MCFMKNLCVQISSIELKKEKKETQITFFRVFVNILHKFLQ